MKFVQKNVEKRLELDIDDPFYVFDVENLKSNYRQWIEKIPQVQPFYAVKCNNEESVLRSLAELGSGFDCASINEFKQVLKLKVDPERIIYAHPSKQISHLKFAANKNILKVTFDSLEELVKIKKFHSKAQVVLRIRYDASNSVANLGSKFGCDPDFEAPELIKLCKSLELNLIGLSFHVGSGNRDFEVYKGALATCRRLFDFAELKGIKLNFLDIGGGFMDNEMAVLDDYAKPINDALEEYFSDPSIKIISEPGRYMVESAFTLAVEIVLKKVASNGHVNYYINEGIHQSFMISYLFKDRYTFSIIRRSQIATEENKLTTIWGNSCNSKDKIIDEILMPELNSGDWLIFHNMGHYTISNASTFNGFKIGDVLDYFSNLIALQ